MSKIPIPSLAIENYLTIGTLAADVNPFTGTPFFQIGASVYTEEEFAAFGGGGGEPVTGDTGVDGATGPDGDTGPTGPTGDTGPSVVVYYSDKALSDFCKSDVDNAGAIVTDLSLGFVIYTEELTTYSTPSHLDVVVYDSSSSLILVDQSTNIFRQIPIYNGLTSAVYAGATVNLLNEYNLSTVILTADTVTVQLPTPISKYIGRIIVIRRTSLIGSLTINVGNAADEKIVDIPDTNDKQEVGDGTTTSTISKDAGNHIVSLMCDGSNWYIY